MERKSVREGRRSLRKKKKGDGGGCQKLGSIAYSSRGIFRREIVKTKKGKLPKEKQSKKAKWIGGG